MAITDFMKHLKLDVWYRATLYLSAILLVVSMLVEIKGVAVQDFRRLALGGVLLSIGEWMNHETGSGIKPPNAYTGPVAYFSYTKRRWTLFGILATLAGLYLLIRGSWSLFV